MPQIKCPIRITCPGSDDPTINFSSEGIDQIRFGATGWTVPVVDPPLPPTDPPVIPNGYLAYGCLGLCFSSVSQEEANLCAAAQAYVCGGGGGGPHIFYNHVQQCAFPCPDGTSFLFTTAAGLFAAFTQAEADQVALDYACDNAAKAYICLGNLTSSICAGAAYSSSTTVTGGLEPMAFSIASGALPPGLNLSSGPDGRTVIVSGTPTTPGVYTFDIGVTDAAGHFAYKMFSITVAGVDQSVLPNGQVNSAYSQTLTASNMGVTLIWSVTAGTLPPGLSLNSTTGVISGTPTTAGLYTFTVSAQTY